MDAEKMVSLAQTWENVPEQRTCSVAASTSGRQTGPVSNLVDYVVVDRRRNCQVTKLEHVRVNFTLRAKKRGAVTVHLESPMGTVSEIIPKRFAMNKLVRPSVKG
jgi:subtilisin-like proprotein convertase family protein